MQTVAARRLNGGTVSDRVAGGRRGVATLALARRAGRLPGCAGATVWRRPRKVPHACMRAWIDRRRMRRRCA